MYHGPKSMKLCQVKQCAEILGAIANFVFMGDFTCSSEIEDQTKQEIGLES